MKATAYLIKRNSKLFFKDKGMFFTSLITPGILLVLYATFLSNVYKDSFSANLPTGITLPEGILNGLVGGQLISSLLAVSCITVAFCANFLMVQDKINGSLKDLRMSPVKPSELAIGYYAATLISTLIICLSATGLSLAYIGIKGWYMSTSDVICFITDSVLLVFFGTALSSVINFFLSSQGQLSAVGTIVSACYGFICGAYMPISSFGSTLQKTVSLLPGTYGTSLLRNHALRGALFEMETQGIPTEVINSLRDSLDCNLYFFGKAVSIPAMYLILVAATLFLVGVYILINALKKKS